MPNLPKITLYCVDKDKDIKADVLERTDKRIKAVIVGTTAVVIMTRTDVRKPYIGSAAGMEFTTLGK